MNFDPIHIWNSMSSFNKLITACLLLMGLATVAVAVERVIALSKSASTSRAFAAQIQGAMAEWDTAAIITIATRHKASILARLFDAVVTRFVVAEGRPEGGLTPVEAARNEAARQQEALGAELRRGMPILATVGSISPFVGLLGTVFGIIASFQSIGAAGSAGLGTVSVGIAEALIETALGLFVAIPAVIVFNHLSHRIGAIESALGRSVSRLLDEMEYRHGKPEAEEAQVPVRSIPTRKAA